MRELLRTAAATYRTKLEPSRNVETPKQAAVPASISSCERETGIVVQPDADAIAAVLDMQQASLFNNIELHFDRELSDESPARRDVAI